MLLVFRRRVSCWLLPALLFGCVCSHATAASPDEPPALVSANGVLDATLEAAPRTIAIGETKLAGAVYNGLYPGPTLRVRPGDLLRVTLVNHLNEPTNLHFHGIQTSPRENSDNVHVLVPPGQSFHYEIRIPADQPPGLYWYHAHAHGLALAQVTGGLSGAIVVEGIEALLTVPRDIAEHVFVLKDVEYDETNDQGIPDDLHDLSQTINGRTHVSVTMRPGETQLWRFSNQSADLYFHLAARGHQFRIVAEDGVVLRVPKPADTLHIGPASRVEALITAGPPGEYKIISDKVLTGSALFRELGTLTVAGEPEPRPPATASPAWALEDLRARTVTAHRTVVFSQDDDTQTYRINGHMYEHGRIDTRVPFGSTEEWTIRNDTDDMHVFHIHQLSFQVTAINDVAQPFDGYLDVVRVPERGSVTLLLPFTRRETIGRFVYHCHVLKHEDRGMMAEIEVYDPSGIGALFGSMFDQPIRWFRQHLHSWRTGLPLEFCDY